MSDVEKGLPLTALDRIVHAIAPDDTGFAYRVVPPRNRGARRGALCRVSPRRRAAASPGSPRYGHPPWTYGRAMKPPVAGCSRRT